MIIDIYLQLENHLITKERLRSYTKAGLRTRLNEEALQALEAHEKTATAQN